MTGMFKRKRKSAPPPSPAREALIAADSALAAGRVRLSEAEARVVRLRAAVEAEAPARRALADALAEFGGSGEMVVGLVAASQAAETAAAAARSGLPAAEAAVKEAGEAVQAAETAKQRAVASVLVEECDRLGRRYVAAFKTLTALHDELAGAAQAIDAMGPPITLATVHTIELPRFRLASMPQGYLSGERMDGSLYSPFLKHVPHDLVIGKFAATWRSAAATLAASPSADIGPLVGADAVAAAAAEVPPALINLPRRARADEGLTVDEVLWGRDAKMPDRKRRHQVLGGDAA
jgi:hypothetical protein